MQKQAIYLTRDEAAKRIGTTRGVLAVWATDPNKRAELPFETNGRRVRYLESDVEAYKAAQESKWKRRDGST